MRESRGFWCGPWVLSFSFSLKIMTFRRRIENIREAGFNFQEAAPASSLSFSLLLFATSVSPDRQQLCTPTGAVSFDLARATRLLLPSLLLLAAAVVVVVSAATAAAASSLLLLRPLYCLNGRRSASSSAPVSQLIHGCCYTFAHSIRYMTARSPSPSSFSPVRFTPLEKATARIAER